MILWTRVNRHELEMILDLWAITFLILSFVISKMGVIVYGQSALKGCYGWTMKVYE